jgi:quercetin dioxygenase-like cupin family protein
VIFAVNQNDLEWIDYQGSIGADGRAGVRVKPLTRRERDVPPMQYVEYAPGHTDPVHRHETDEVFIVVDGELWLDDASNGPGSVVFISRDTDYAVRAGDAGVRYFRVVFPG